MAFFELDDVFGYQDANDIKKLWAGDTAPTAPGTGEVWLDTSSTPNQLKRYNGSSWDTIGELTAGDLLNLIKTVDGSGSGLDADTLDGLHGSGYMKKNITENTSGRVTFLGGDHTWDSTGSRGALECKTPDGTDPAIMAFQRPGYYAAYFGLDTDNQWKVGGWSMGDNRYKLWHEGNDGSGSGLDADTVDGLQSSSLVQTSGTQTVAGTKTFTGQVTLEFPVIPLSKPSGAVNGTIWIA